MVCKINNINNSFLVFFNLISMIRIYKKVSTGLLQSLSDLYAKLTISIHPFN